MLCFGIRIFSHLSVGQVSQKWKKQEQDILIEINTNSGVSVFDRASSDNFFSFFWREMFIVSISGSEHNARCILDRVAFITLLHTL